MMHMLITISCFHISYTVVICHMLIHCMCIVMLQPLDIHNADRSKHKFMVQSVVSPPGEVNIEDIVRSLCI